MTASSGDETPMGSWLNERRTQALAAFDDQIPLLYRRRIYLNDHVAQWADQDEEAPTSLFLWGPLGVGKTHNAWQATRRWVGQRFAGNHRGTPVVQTWRSTALFDALRPDDNGGSPKRLMKQLQTADLLYIDDVAAARVSPTGWTQERLYEIFDERYINRLPILITSDVKPSQISHIVGERVTSRAAEIFRGGVVHLSGADRRQGGEAA
ncbi:DnaA/Hda family protein [Streptomyces sp. B27]|uniref:DnaA ATPase domain-containing protein n=1 Tax=Streptomyces sp. B27 TaxID=2485015 RepID=UPI000FD8035A|nr:DnaA/Hda family protein [Streptomyces sp. B27]